MVHTIQGSSKVLDFFFSLKLIYTIFSTKAVFESAENRFKKSFSVKPTCLATTENRISGK